MRKSLKKYSLIFIGILCVVLAVLGAILPLLPTTPFLLLALMCFAKSSPRLHQALLNNRYFGESLQQWEADRSISRKTKIKAILLIVLSFSGSIFILQGRLPLQIGLVCLGSVLLFLILRLPETERATVKSSSLR